MANNHVWIGLSKTIIKQIIGKQGLFLDKNAFFASVNFLGLYTNVSKNAFLNDKICLIDMVDFQAQIHIEKGCTSTHLIKNQEIISYLFVF